MSVTIPETLFFELVDLLRQPKFLCPSSGECVLHLEKRNRALGQLLTIRRAIAEDETNPAFLNADLH
ncbi:MAG: hypothetical protein ACLFOY_09025 [Desulfatibacillaceae bacterium]